MTNFEKAAEEAKTQTTGSKKNYTDYLKDIKKTDFIVRISDFALSVAEKDVTKENNNSFVMMALDGSSENKNDAQACLVALGSVDNFSRIARAMLDHPVLGEVIMIEAIKKLI